MSLALYRTYRPQKFSDVVGQPHVTTTIQNQFEMGRLAHAYLFTGPRGIGKTTTARLLAKLVNCEKPKQNEPCNSCSACEQITSGSALDLYEVDAASNTDVENVRENIIKSVRFAPNQLKKKVFIIDEAHMLSTSAFNALLKTLEEPPEHAMFILATTEIHKVPETIVSRCQRFDFRKIQKDIMMERLREIAKSEEIKIDDAVLEQVVRHGSGCARDCESLLGQLLALGEKHITLDLASLVLPATTAVFVETFLQHLLARDAQASISDLNTFIEQGIDLKTFVDDVISALRDKLFEQLSGRDESISFLRQALSSLLDAKTKIRSEHLPQLPIELAIVELCSSSVDSTQDFNQQGVGSSCELSQDLSLRGASKASDDLSTEALAKVEAIFDRGCAMSPGHRTVAAVPSDIAQPRSNHIHDLSETVFDTIPVISIDEVREKWPQVFEQIKQCNASLPLFMQSCEVCGVSGEHVELGFAYDLYVQTVNKDKNRRLIEGVLEKVLGKRIKVKAIQKIREEEEGLKELVSEFGGTVI